MKYVICSIRDAKAESWVTPMVFQTRAAAVRSFQDAVNGAQNGKNEFAAHPEDYTLFAIGYFNEVTGEVTGLSPESLGLGSNLVRSV